ncbi:MAG: hypothetical protein IJM28_02360, partial [Lachnospiraceae bacterium]|nr:hypothetical protein [Lachnospiraceae bacterium]
MKKRLAALLLGLVMVGTTLAGCGNTAPTSQSAAPAATTEAKTETETKTEEPAPAATSDENIKIGVSIWSSTDVLGSQCKLILDEAAKALGVQVQYVDQGHV